MSTLQVTLVPTKPVSSPPLTSQQPSGHRPRWTDTLDVLLLVNEADDPSPPYTKAHSGTARSAVKSMQPPHKPMAGSLTTWHVSLSHTPHGDSPSLYVGRSFQASLYSER